MFDALEGAAYAYRMVGGAMTDPQHLVPPGDEDPEADR